MIRAVLFDFGGVLAEEGYRNALEDVARHNKLDPGEFFILAARLIYETGYIIGKSDEKTYVDILRQVSGIRATHEELRWLLLAGFTIRPEMIALADGLRTQGVVTGIFSDQTDWLEQIDAREHLFQHFDYVFNSFRMGMAKNEERTFGEVCLKMGLKPAETVFIDDNPGNVGRAAEMGLNAILFVGIPECIQALRAAGLRVGGEA